MMKNKKFLIFDFDGTLVNSTEIGLKMVELTLEKINLKKVERKFLLHHWGKEVTSLTQLICKEAGGDENSFDLFTLHYQQIWQTGQKYDFDVLEIKKSLENLKAFGYKLGIITSRTRQSLYDYLRTVKIPENIFDFIQAEDDYTHRKPSGKVFIPALEFAKEKQIKPNEIVYFGDTVNYDLTAAKNSNPQIDFIGVSSGVNTYEDFLQAGLTKKRVLKSIKDLPPYLNKMVKELIET
jgi:HAD superfamily hydrolase (TIGR01549 family)